MGMSRVFCFSGCGGAGGIGQVVRDRAAANTVAAAAAAAAHLPGEQTNKAHDTLTCSPSGVSVMISMCVDFLFVCVGVKSSSTALNTPTVNCSAPRMRNTKAPRMQLPPPHTLKARTHPKIRFTSPGPVK